MQTNKISILLLSAVCCFGDSFGQTVSYWSGKKKITLKIDSSQTIVNLIDRANSESIKSIIKNLDNTYQLSDFQIGKRFGIVIKKSNTKIHKYLEMV